MEKGGESGTIYVLHGMYAAEKSGIDPDELGGFLLSIIDPGIYNSWLYDAASSPAEEKAVAAGIVLDVITVALPIARTAFRVASRGARAVRATSSLKMSRRALAAAACFVAGTQIKTKNGPKVIENIQVGDTVWAFDETTGNKALKTVYNAVIRQSDHLQQLVIGTDTIKTTDDHPFYVNKRWVKAIDLRIGDSLNLFNGEKFVLSEKSRIDTLVTVYNFAVTDYATYYIGEQEILVHNNNPCAALPKITKAVNSNMPHAVERAVERGVFANSAAAKEGIGNLTKKISSGNLPTGTIVDPSHADRILVPIGNNGMAAYQIGRNGTAKLKTILNAK